MLNVSRYQLSSELLAAARAADVSVTHLLNRDGDLAPLEHESTSREAEKILPPASGELTTGRQVTVIYGH